MKMDSLSMLFERERTAMSNALLLKLKVKKHKQLYTKLAMIDDNRRNAVLSEYFNACKMAFRIKATVNYVWNMDKNLEHVFDLYQNDSTFQKMQQMLAQSLLNAFGATSPTEPVIGDIIFRQSS